MAAGGGALLGRLGLARLRAAPRGARGLKGLRVGVAREGLEGERRVALCPANAAQLAKRGAVVAVEKGAGAASGFPDSAYEVGRARSSSPGGGGGGMAGGGCCAGTRSAASAALP